MRFYLVYRDNGRYDPVLDDQEPLYDQIDQTDDELVDFVPLSDPSEVFMTIPHLSREPSTNPDAISRGASELADPSRSMTASPFVLPSKPYRPFSTEPIPEVPPLEDPIVLNPNYHDEFGHADDEDFLPKSKFKLPISEQYDPGNEKSKLTKKDSSMRIDLGKKETEMKEDLMFMKQMRQDIDLERMEKSVATVTELTNVAVAASNVVEESLFKAVTVAEEIKKEIDVELTSFESSEVKSSKTEQQAKFTSNVMESSDVQQSTKSREKTTGDIVKEVSKRTKMEMAQSLQTERESVSIKEQESKQDLEETIVAGTVKRLSNNFDKEMVKSATAAVEINAQRTTVKDTQIKESDMKLDKTIAQKDTKSSVTNKQTTKTAQKCAVSETKSQKATKEQNKTKYSTERLLAEQRAYTIGLQTIPNIRGKVHSSYHYDLLLKTFFIHLTDVMVALSRFILAENVLGLERGQSTEDERVVRKENIVEQEVLSTQEYSVNDEETVQQQNIGQKQDVIVLVKAEKEQAIDDHELAEKRKISGARMAQMSSHKSEELTEKMEAVINEFQTKSGLEESSEQKTLSLRERRSRSKSKVEEEVSKESDPLEWLSKKEEARQVISDTVQACKAVEEVTESEICVTESKKETSKVDHVTTEKREDRRSKSKDRNTYIAIVESHVYTNKDAILEEHLSGCSSVQDSAEIKQSTENIFLENAQSSKSVEETKQVTKEEVAMETASVNVEETKKLLLEEARKASITEVSKQHVTKIEKEVEISKVQKLAEVSKKVTEPEPIVEEVEEKVVLKMKPAEIIQEDVQATVQILKEMPVSPEIIEISEETSMMSGSRQESSFRSGISTEKFESKTQEVYQTQRSDVNQQTHQLSLELKQEGYKIFHSDSFPSTIDTPTPATVPPTPLTDEYVFRLEIPLPKTAGLPPVEEPEASPEKETDHEDLNIVKKKWEIDSPTIQAVVYDPPLPTPLEVKDAPKFSNAVLSEANDGSMSEEEILEIGRKSSLLASAIDETIKCIEEYKEQVGMETKRSISEETKKKDLKIEDITQPMYTGIVAEAKTTVYADAASKTSEDAEKHKENWSKVTEQFKNNGKAAVIISKASESTAKDSFAINSTEIERKDLTSSFGSQNVTETIATSTKPAENVAFTTDSIKETFSVKSAVKQKKDVLTSNIVSQNTDAINKLSEYSSSMTDSLMKDAFDSKTTSVESKNVLSSSYETQNLDTSILTSSITAETVRESEKSIDELAKITQSLITQNKELKTDPLQKVRSVPFNPEELKQRAASGEAAVNGSRSVQLNVASNNQGRQLATPRNVVVDGEVLATHQGIISGVEDVIIDEETAKELGKPGLTEERIAEIMSGESEMLREAHVMGLSRVIASHMTRVDENDSSVDFKKIKPTIEKLKDSEVLKALNDELTKTKEEIKKEERKWTTFLQKPDRPQPQAKFGYHGWLPQFIPPQERYKVKIVKQPKPKVAPDYKPEDFETGLLPWELRAATEPPPPPVAAEDPILIPEEGPEFYEAVDPLPESEVPDLEETGIPLPPEKVTAPEPEPELEEPEACPENIKQIAEEEPQEPPAEEDSEEMEQNRLAEQLLNNVQSMVDPNATLEQQLAQMRAQLAALAQLPGVIQQSLELVTRQLMQITQQESTKVVTQSDTVQEAVEQTEEIRTTETNQETAEEGEETQVEASRQEHVTQEIQQTRPPEATPEEIERMCREEQEILEEQRRVEKQKKELMEQIQLEQESRQLKQRPTPRVGRPKPAFGPLVPAERPLVLPGGRKWRKPKDAYNEQFIAETLTAQAEIIQGKTKGVNFMKYEKPPVSLEHLKDSDVYKLIHNMEQVPMRRVDMLTPVIAECDYREKCRSVTPCRMAHSHGEHLDIPEQVAP